MRHLRNHHFQPLLSFTKLNAIARAVVPAFIKGIPLPDALNAAPPFRKYTLEGTFHHDDPLWRETIDMQNIPLSRGGSLLGVIFHIPNDGFLYYDPEEALASQSSLICRASRCSEDPICSAWLSLSQRNVWLVHTSSPLAHQRSLEGTSRSFPSLAQNDC